MHIINRIINNPDPIKWNGLENPPIKEESAPIAESKQITK